VSSEAEETSTALTKLCLKSLNRRRALLLPLSQNLGEWGIRIEPKTWEVRRCSPRFSLRISGGFARHLQRSVCDLQRTDSYFLWRSQPDLLAGKTGSTHGHSGIKIRNSWSLDVAGENIRCHQIDYLSSTFEVQDAPKKPLMGI
jgi:hypothetical protein